MRIGWNVKWINGVVKRREVVDAFRNGKFETEIKRNWEDFVACG